MSHAGSKPYVCPICDKRFTQISSLAKHKQIHAPKDFMQQYCNLSLINNNSQAKDYALNENKVTIHYSYWLYLYLYYQYHSRNF